MGTTTITKLTLSDLAPKSFQLPLKHPSTGDDLGVTLTVHGYDSTVYLDAAKSLYNLRTVNEQVEADLSTIEREAAMLTAASVTGWDNDEFFGGAFSTELITSIVSDNRYTWLTTQITAAQQDKHNFFAV